jgi:hypothetical protein
MIARPIWLNFSYIYKLRTLVVFLQGQFFTYSVFFIIASNKRDQLAKMIGTFNLDFAYD